MTPIVVVLGTGTDVGKTHVSSALIRALRDRGVKVEAWKPVATGVREAYPYAEDSDMQRLAAATLTPVVPPWFVSHAPVSAFRAARMAGQALTPRPLVERAQKLASGCELLLVETAGGALSPLNLHVTNVELVKELSPCWTVLVAPDRLGVLHEVTATTLAMQSRGVRVDALVLSAPETPDPSTGGNASELADLGVGKVCAAFPRAAPESAASQLAASLVWNALGGFPPK